MQKNILRFIKLSLSFKHYNKDSYVFVTFSIRYINPSEINIFTDNLFSIIVMLMVIIIMITIHCLIHFKFSSCWDLEATVQ
jgi:hypothetical protein